MFKTARTDTTNQASSVYDASGMRVATKLYDVWQFFIYDAFGKKVAEYGGLQAADEGGVKYLLSDWQGSTRAVLNNTGVVNARMDYTAFGEEIQAGTGQRTTAQGFGANNNLRDKYALTERDQATGLDHTWFRKNENKAGRWTSPDPYNGSMNIGNPQSFNRYSYVENDPVNFVDPSGLNRASPGTSYGPAIQGYGVFNGGLAGVMYQFEQLRNVSFQINNATIGMGNTVSGLNLYVPAHSGATVSYLPSGSSNSGLDNLQTGLDVVGITEIPVVSSIADVVNACISLGRGDYLGAGLSLGAAIPGAGAAFNATRLARTLGRAGEAAVGVGKHGTRIPSTTGAAYRVPDILNFETRVLGEVKNVSRLSYTGQLRDFLNFSQQNNLRFDLYVRPTTKLSGPLRDAVSRGDINLKCIK